jgi:hypothetical protein
MLQCEFKIILSFLNCRLQRVGGIFTMKKEAGNSSETFESTYKSARWHNPQDGDQRLSCGS